MRFTGTERSSPLGLYVGTVGLSFTILSPVGPFGNYFIDAAKNIKAADKSQEADNNLCT